MEKCIPIIKNRIRDAPFLHLIQIFVLMPPQTLTTRNNFLPENQSSIIHSIIIKILLTPLLNTAAESFNKLCFVWHDSNLILFLNADKSQATKCVNFIIRTILHKININSYEFKINITSRTSKNTFFLCSFLKFHKNKFLFYAPKPLITKKLFEIGFIDQ